MVKWLSIGGGYGYDNRSLPYILVAMVFEYNHLLQARRLLYMYLYMNRRWRGSQCLPKVCGMDVPNCYGAGVDSFVLALGFEIGGRGGGGVSITLLTTHTKIQI